MAKAFPTYSSSVIRPAKTSVGSNQPVFAGETIAVTAAQLTLGALFGSIRVPKGAEILAVQLAATDLDSSTGITLAIGDTGDDDRLLTANTVAQAGGVVGPTIASTGFAYEYTAETLISVKVAVAPSGTPAAGTIKYGVWYVSQ